MKLKIHDLATMFDVDEKVVFRWVREEYLPSQFVNQQYRFSHTDVIEWATVKHIKVPLALLRLRNGDFRLGEFVDALELGGVQQSIAGEDKFAVFQAVTQRIPALHESERENLCELLLTRENRGTTAIGDGIAIPHPSFPIALTADRSLVSLCYLDHPQDFGAADKKLVHALFVIVTPNIRLHTILLAQLASAVHYPAFRDAVRRHAPAAEILDHAAASETLNHALQLGPNGLP